MIEWNAQVNDKTIKSLIKAISIGTIEIANGTVPSNFYYQPKKSEIISALLRDRMCIRNYKKQILTYTKINGTEALLDSAIYKNVDMASIFLKWLYVWRTCYAWSWLNSFEFKNVFLDWSVSKMNKE